MNLMSFISLENLSTGFFLTGFSVIFVVGLLLFLFRKRAFPLALTWASAKTWLLLFPLILWLANFPAPWPTILIGIICIYSCRLFFRMVGVYQFSEFVIICYLFIAIMVYCIEKSHYQMIAFLPLALLTCTALVPLAKRSFSRMVQYTSLSLLTFLIFGWSLMHLAMILQLRQGIYFIIYICILSEINSLSFSFLSYYIRKSKVRLQPLRKVAPNFTFGGWIGGMVMTLVSSFFLYHFLLQPVGEGSVHVVTGLMDIVNEPEWIILALLISNLGYLGTIMMTTFRKDLKVKSPVMGPLVIPHHDLLSFVDKLIFVVPVFYYYLVFPVIL